MTGTKTVPAAMISVVVLLALGSAGARAQEIVRIPSFDQVIIEGRLHVPASGYINKIVIDVPSSGPHTYENRRQLGRSTVFKYHDYFMDEFARRGIAYFSYSTRYTVPDSTTPPNYDKVDKERFFSYTPSIKVKDLEAVVAFLKKDSRLASSRFAILGFSEGTILATMLAERKRVSVDGLFLAGVPTEDTYSTIQWQLSGQSSMINYRRFFDTNKDKIIQRAEFEAADPRARARVGGKSFTELDVNADSVLTADDFQQILASYRQQVFAAIDANDNEWIWSSFFRVGAPWIKEHRAIEPNRTRILRLDLPIYLFHGTDDASCPVEGVVELQRRAQELEKRNIHVLVFPNHDHSLEFLGWVVTRSLPDGLKAVFDAIERF